MWRRCRLLLTCIHLPYIVITYSCRDAFWGFPNGCWSNFHETTDLWNNSVKWEWSLWSKIDWYYWFALSLAHSLVRPFIPFVVKAQNSATLKVQARCTSFYNVSLKCQLFCLLVTSRISEYQAKTSCKDISAEHLLCEGVAQLYNWNENCSAVQKRLFQQDVRWKKTTGGKQPNVILWKKTGGNHPMHASGLCCNGQFIHAFLFLCLHEAKLLFPKTCIGLKLRQISQSSFKKCHLGASSVCVGIFNWPTFKSQTYSQKRITPTFLF